MITINSRTNVFSDFLALVHHLLPYSDHAHKCPALSDEQFIAISAMRLLEGASSGRAILQRINVGEDKPVGNSVFFESLKSKRRLMLVRSLNKMLSPVMKQGASDSFSKIHSLRDYEVFAADGHSHQHAVHDECIEGKKRAVNHIYAQNLRTQQLIHLTLCDPDSKREHEIRALKRLERSDIRAGAAAEKDVILVYDRACIAYRQWIEWRRQGVHIITRTKEGNALERMGVRPFDKNDAINAGVLADELIGSAGTGEVLRRVTFYDITASTTYEYVTNVMNVEPGVIAYLYRCRWDIEKTYDSFKNKLGQIKAWASSENAKNLQAEMICLVHNLLVILERRIEKEGVTNVAEDKRRAQRLARTKAVLPKGSQLPSLIDNARKATQLSLKLIRWLAACFWSKLTWDHALHSLRRLYQSL